MKGDAYEGRLVKHNPNMSADEKRKLKGSTFKGWELVQSTARLCAMNLMLHSIGTDKDLPIIVSDLWLPTRETGSTSC
jgi:type I restriction enzyme M protein